VTGAGYAPDGPIGTVPHGAFIPPKARREVLLSALDGVELGDYDRIVIDWVAGLDDSVCRVMVSLIRRARQAEQGS
jgi:hypothetical protein